MRIDSRPPETVTSRCFTAVFGVLALLAALAVLPGAAQATNGDNLISVAPTSRSMGGVGIAAPQDSVGAVFANPAAMCFTPFCPSSRLDASVTLFKPQVESTITQADGTYHAKSEEKIYPIPAIGLSSGFSQNPQWRFGIAAYGVSGLGVDYRSSDLDKPDTFGNPVASGTFTDLQRAKVAPTLAWQPLPELSVGASVHLHRATLDLGNGPKEGYAVGIQPGIIYRPVEEIAIGATYVSPQQIKHHNVADFDGNGERDDLILESPQYFGFGVAWEPFNQSFLVEADVKWVNWGNAKGYKDFGWKDQWVFNVGGQYKVLPNLTLRAGYNYAESPVETNDGFDGTKPREVQGTSLPGYYYETFRIVGFPGIVEHHMTLGAEWEIFERFSLNLAYMHAFENKISEEGTDIYGRPVTIESKLSEDSLGLGVSWIF